VEGLLLAAGAGRRMGMPKALVTDNRGSWLVRGVDLLHDGGCERVTVVLGASTSILNVMVFVASTLPATSWAPHVTTCWPDVPTVALAVVIAGPPSSTR